LRQATAGGVPAGDVRVVAAAKAPHTLYDVRAGCNGTNAQNWTFAGDGTLIS
jgi:hypothetical protein